MGNLSDMVLGAAMGNSMPLTNNNFIGNMNQPTGYMQADPYQRFLQAMNLEKNNNFNTLGMQNPYSAFQYAQTPISIIMQGDNIISKFIRVLNGYPAINVGQQSTIAQFMTLTDDQRKEKLDNEIFLMLGGKKVLEKREKELSEITKTVPAHTKIRIKIKKFFGADGQEKDIDTLRVKKPNIVRLSSSISIEDDVRRLNTFVSGSTQQPCNEINKFFAQKWARMRTSMEEFTKELGITFYNIEMHSKMDPRMFDRGMGTLYNRYQYNTLLDSIGSSSMGGSLLDRPPVARDAYESIMNALSPNRKGMSVISDNGNMVLNMDITKDIPKGGPPAKMEIVGSNAGQPVYSMSMAQHDAQTRAEPAFQRLEASLQDLINKASKDRDRLIHQVAGGGDIS